MGCSFWLGHWTMPFSGLGLVFGSKGQLALRLRRPDPWLQHHSRLGERGPLNDPHRPGSPSPTSGSSPAGPPLLLRSKKEALLTSWVLGKFKEMTVLKRGLCIWFLSVKDVAGSADISLKSFNFFSFKHQRWRTSFSVEKAASTLPSPDQT